MSFPPQQRQVLLTTQGVSDTVIVRLEAIGVDSMEKLHRMGVNAAVQAICEHLDSTAWRNRRRPLMRALAQWASEQPIR